MYATLVYHTQGPIFTEVEEDMFPEPFGIAFCNY